MVATSPIASKITFNRSLERHHDIQHISNHKMQLIERLALFSRIKP
jgi:hypothetical protein